MMMGEVGSPLMNASYESITSSAWRSSIGEGSAFSASTSTSNPGQPGVWTVYPRAS